MKHIIYFFIGLLFMWNTATANSFINLAPAVLKSQQVQKYLKTEEAKSFALIGIQWSGTGGDVNGNLIEFQLQFFTNQDGSLKFCTHKLNAYYSRNAQGTEVLKSVALDNYEMICKK